MPQLRDQKPHGLGMVRGNLGKLRKAKIAILSLDDFITWLCDGKCRRAIGIPPDSKVIGADYNLVTNSLYLAIENESFPEVPNGEAIGHLDLIFQDCSELEDYAARQRQVAQEHQ